MELSQDLVHIPVIFIRFNPNKYLIGNTKINSCWSINKNGITCVKKESIKQWD